MEPASPTSYTANYDGKDNPVSGTGAPGGADTIALKRIDSNTVEATWKKVGKIVMTSRWLGVARNLAVQDGISARSSYHEKHTKLRLPAPDSTAQCEVLLPGRPEFQ